MATGQMSGVRADLTLKPSWYWPIQSSTRTVLASRVFLALLLVALVLGNPRRLAIAVPAFVVMVLAWLVWFLLLSARARTELYSDKIRLREVVGGPQVVSRAHVKSVRLCSVKETWYQERAILLMADADGCLGGLHGRGWTREHANRIAQTLGVPLNGEFAEMIDTGLLRRQWPAGTGPGCPPHGRVFADGLG